MKLFLIGSLLFSGGTAAAMQNEEIREGVTEVYKNVRERVQKRVKENSYVKLREEGFPYPSEERCENLTEEQVMAIYSAIDQVNATYDWANMTDDEIDAALLVIQEDFNLLADELGLNLPDNWLQGSFAKRVNKKTRTVMKEHLLENLRETGIEYPSEKRLANLTEEQAAAIVAKIDELNATYDWANMTDDEILEAMSVVKDELHTLHDELGLAPVGPKGPRGRRSEKTKPEGEVVEGTDEV